MGKPNDRDMIEERGMDNAPHCVWNGYIVIDSQLIAQNNPDSEYIQYSTRRGAECEVATESARRTVRGGACMQAAKALRLRSTTQSVGQPILTWIVK